LADAKCFSVQLLLTATAAVSLVLALVGPALASEEAGIVTIQAAAPKTTVGQPYTFTVFVKNDSVDQGVDLEDSLPSDASLISAIPSQGNCDLHRGSAGGRDIVECAFGVIPSGNTAKLEIIVTPTTPGVVTNTATATPEISPITATNSSSASVRVKPAPV
jgi:uncharacterized repeat protein (TIGR01451 family)